MTNRTVLTKLALLMTAIVIVGITQLTSNWTVIMALLAIAIILLITVLAWSVRDYARLVTGYKEEQVRERVTRDGRN